MKRILDIILSLLVAIVFFPIIVATAIMVWASLGRPLLFRQMRAGQGGREFSLLKWRSMTSATGANGQVLPDEQRNKPVGLLIRRLRIDELPSILNILRGDLSFVGPRPLPLSNPINRRGDYARLAIPPGFTGLSQVSGNTLLSDTEKLAIDLHYIDHRTLTGDIAIIWRTLITVLMGERRDEILIARAMESMEKRHI